jgi:hypothetical protein
LKLWARTRSKMGTRDLIDERSFGQQKPIFFFKYEKYISEWKSKKKFLHTMMLYGLKVRRRIDNKGRRDEETRRILRWFSRDYLSRTNIYPRDTAHT